MSEGRAHELLVVLEWLTSTLRGDSALMAEFDNALYEHVAPLQTPAKYLVYRNASPLGEVLYGEGGRRIWVTYTVDVLGWTESGNLMDLAAGMLRVDRLLAGRSAERTTTFPGTMQECSLQYSYEPPSEQRPDGGITRGLGGRYRIRVTADG